MKSVWISWILLVIISVFIVVHAFVINSMSDDIRAYSEDTKTAASDDRWEDAGAAMEKIKNRWEKSELWAELTIGGEQLGDIEVSLERSQVYLRDRDKTSFLSEIAQFEILIHDLAS